VPFIGHRGKHEVAGDSPVTDPTTTGNCLPLRKEEGIS